MNLLLSICEIGQRCKVHMTYNNVQEYSNIFDPFRSFTHATHADVFLQDFPLKCRADVVHAALAGMKEKNG